MSRETGNSWNHLGVRSVDGMLEAVPFRVWIREPDWESNMMAFRKDPTQRKHLFRVEWHTLNLKSGEISETLSTMPPETRSDGTAVACGNRLYVLGGLCVGDPSCPDLKFDSIHNNNCVFYFDCARADCGWQRAPPMLVPRLSPSAVAIGEKIYVFGSTPLTECCFAEVFNIHENRWDMLPSPPVSSLDVLCSSDPVLFDHSRSRILVHFSTSHSLYAFSPAPDGGSWECLDTEFWSWTNASTIVDDVAYFLFDPISDWVTHSDSRISFGGYHLVDKRWLPIRWHSDAPLPIWFSPNLFHLGNGLLCLATYSSLEHSMSEHAFNYIKIRVNLYDGKVNAIAEPGLSISSTVPFEFGFGPVTLTALNAVPESWRERRKEKEMIEAGSEEDEEGRKGDGKRKKKKKQKVRSEEKEIQGRKKEIEGRRNKTILY
ncbi:hypothetical protein V6N13_023463 [Hibiscus sabdariffa]